MGRHEYPVAPPKPSWHVIDGDSIRFLLDRGMRDYTDYICRLLNTDCPELKRDGEAAELAKEVVEVWLGRFDHEEIDVQSVHLDKFAGRYDGVVTHRPTGETLNDFLLEKGIARPYLGGARDPWEPGELDEVINRCRSALVELRNG